MAAALEELHNKVREKEEIIRLKDELIGQLDGQLKRAQGDIERMRTQLEDLLRRLYGRRSEKLDIRQLLMDGLILDADGEVTAPEPPPTEQTSAKPRRKRKAHGRRPLPDHLPRQEIIVRVSEEEKICPLTGEARPFIGYEESEKLEYIPETLQVNVYKREKYGSPLGAEEGGVVTAPPPPVLLDRCLADTGLLTQVAVAKFEDHQPLYRQEKILLRQGVEVSRKTMAGWLSAMAERLKVFAVRIAEMILEGTVVHHDDTPVKMLDPGAGKTRETRFWVAVSGSGPPLVHFSFSTDRKQETPLNFFKDYRGSVMCDEYAGYQNLDWLTLLSCWAHARRYFDRAKTTEPAFAQTVLLAIAKLYRIETRIKGLSSDDERQQIRMTESRQQVEEIFALLESRTWRPQSPMAKAVNYTLSKRENLIRFTEDERLPVDNNPAERAIRRIAIGRKNWLFLGSETGGESAAVYFTLFATCQANRINPWAWLHDVIGKLPEQPADQLDELLPHIWIESNHDARLPEIS